jgi:transcription elongation GreA/GreB family factor
MSLKIKIFKACIKQLDDKISSLKVALNDLEKGAENDSKSSAGDKHETGRAMMQLEHEKISRQLNDSLSQKAAIEQMDQAMESAIIASGSLIKTNRGYLFICVALGKITIDGIEIMTLSMQSPLGQRLIGLKPGDMAEINGLHYTVEKVL